MDIPPAATTIGILYSDIVSKVVLHYVARGQSSLRRSKTGRIEQEKWAVRGRNRLFGL